MYSIINRICRMVSKPSAAQIAQRQLEDAKRQLLTYQSYTEHSASMVRYYETSIRRLTAYVEGEK